MLTISLLIAGVALLIFLLIKNKKDNTVIREGDITVLRHSFKNEYASIPENNMLHVLEVEDDSVKVEYISFKDGSYNQQKVKKQVLRKVRKTAA